MWPANIPSASPNWARRGSSGPIASACCRGRSRSRSMRSADSRSGKRRVEMRAGCCAGGPGRVVVREAASAQPWLRGVAADHAGMALIPAGTFSMGNDDDDAFADDGEGPVRDVTMSSYWIDAHAVNNRAFAAFVDEAHYVTDAERHGRSFVFYALLTPETREPAANQKANRAP